MLITIILSKDNKLMKEICTFQIKEQTIHIFIKIFQIIYKTAFTSIIQTTNHIGLKISTVYFLIILLTRL
jgi:hypothetical protein